VVTAKARFISRLLREKYGVVGVVAGRYIGAGYGVKFNIRSGDVLFDIVALKGGEKLAVKVFNGNIVLKTEDVERVIGAARSMGAKPVIILYGRGPRISSDLLEKLDDLEVVVRRIRP